MPEVIVKGDNSCGHVKAPCGGNFPPMASTSGSSNVFVNSVEVVRQGDTYAGHVCSTDPLITHPAPTLSVGSGTVFANSLGIARKGDAISCDDTACGGSTNVFAGG